LTKVVCVVSSAGHPASTGPSLDDAVPLEDPPVEDPPLEEPPEDDPPGLVPDEPPLPPLDEPPLPPVDEPPLPPLDEELVPPSLAPPLEPPLPDRKPPASPPASVPAAQWVSPATRPSAQRPTARTATFTREQGGWTDIVGHLWPAQRGRLLKGPVLQAHESGALCTEAHAWAAINSAQDTY
jgi:hypothetical protein